MSNSGVIIEKQQKKAPVLEYASCPRCGYRESHIKVKGVDRLHKIPGEYQAVECLRCQLWFQNPRPVANRLASLYPQDYLPHQKPTAKPLNSGDAKFLRKHLGYTSLVSDNDEETGFDWRQYVLPDVIRKWHTGVNLIPFFVPQGKLLEIGCASGSRLLSLHRLGWQRLYGIELVPEAADRARAEGFSVITGQVEEVLSQYADNEFDAIVSSMVLEHLYNPFQVIKLVAKKLKPKGQFLFSTVVRDGLDAKIFYDYWSGFDFPRHMVYFQNSDLYNSLEEQFEEVKIFHQNAPVDFIRPAVSRKKEGKGTITDELILRVARSPVANIIGLIFAWIGLTCRVSFHCIRKQE